MAIGRKIRAGNIKAGKPRINTGKPNNSNFGLKPKLGKNIKRKRKVGSKIGKAPAFPTGKPIINTGKPDNTTFKRVGKPSKNIKPVRKMGNKKVRRVNNKGKKILF